MLDLIQQNKLIEQNSTQVDQLSATQSFDGNLSTHAKTRLNRLLNGSMVLRIATRVWSDEDTVASFAGRLQGRIAVVVT
jgi:hypothetical protein